jgi:DNA polymerase-3 subunit epsilon
LGFNNSNRHNINANWNEVAGVYGIFDDQGRCIYIGKTDNLKRRMAEHMGDRSHPMHRYQLAYLLFESLASESERTSRESVLRRELRPLADRL